VPPSAAAPAPAPALASMVRRVSDGSFDPVIFLPPYEFVVGSY